MSDELSVSVVFFNWYRREDYGRFLAVFEDAANFPRSYDDWLKKAEHGDDLQRKSGKRVVRIVFDYDEFIAWCAARKLQINAKARNGYSTFKGHAIALGRNN